jgi:hypothetical protein
VVERALQLLESERSALQQKVPSLEAVGGWVGKPGALSVPWCWWQELEDLLGSLSL